MIKDFVGQEVFDNDTVVCPNPYFPSLWVKATVRTSPEGLHYLEYIDSKKRIKKIVDG